MTRTVNADRPSGVHGPAPFGPAAATVVRGPEPQRDDPAFWDRRYAERGWRTEPDPVVVELVDPLPAGRALDLGCGTGRNALWLARRGWSVTGVDASTVGLSIAAEAAAAERLPLDVVLADLREWRAPAASFDLVLIANVHPDPEQRPAILAAAAGAVALGGHLLLVGHHRDNRRHSPHPDGRRLFTLTALRAELPRDLVRLRVERVVRPPVEPDERPRISVVAWLRRPDATARPVPGPSGPA